MRASLPVAMMMFSLERLHARIDFTSPCRRLQRGESADPFHLARLSSMPTPLECLLTMPSFRSLTFGIRGAYFPRGCLRHRRARSAPTRRPCGAAPWSECTRQEGTCAKLPAFNEGGFQSVLAGANRSRVAPDHFHHYEIVCHCFILATIHRRAWEGNSAFVGRAILPAAGFQRRAGLESGPNHRLLRPRHETKPTPPRRASYHITMSSRSFWLCRRVSPRPCRRGRRQRRRRLHPVAAPRRRSTARPPSAIQSIVVEGNHIFTRETGTRHRRTQAWTARGKTGIRRRARSPGRQRPRSTA